MLSHGNCCVTNDDLNACADIVRRGDPERFMAVMAAPLAARRKLFPIYAFNVEVARAPWVTGEAMIAEMRLQWWRDALGEIAGGGTVRRHEVVTPLSGVLDKGATELLDQLIVARRWDVYRDPFQDEAHFREYIDHTTGHLLRVATQSLGTASGDVVGSAGFAQGLANWFRAIPALEAAGRIPLIDGRPENISVLASEGLQNLIDARKARSEVSRDAGRALLVLWKCAGILKRAKANPNAVAQGALEPAPFQSRIALMFRVATARW